MPSSAEAQRRAGAGGWALIGVVLAAGSLGAALLPRTALDWQPALALVQPWRAWTAVFVHYGTLHLAANLAGLVVLLALGAAARLPRRSALAWLLAWPLTQLGLLLQPALLHYGGLSGVLHAGAAVAGGHLLVAATGLRRAIGTAVLGGLLLKVLLEAPWAGPLRPLPGWDIAVAPAAHASGLATGLLCALFAELSSSRARRASHD